MNETTETTETTETSHDRWTAALAPLERTTPEPLSDPYARIERVIS